MIKPPNNLILLIDIVAAPLVIYVLTTQKTIIPLSIAVYVFSAYALTVTSINFKRLFSRAKELITGDELALVRVIKRSMRKYRYTRLYLESKDFRAEVALYIGLSVNLFFACYKGSTGAATRSPWLFSIGMYYFFLAVIRFIVMLNVRKRNHLESSYSDRKLHEYKIYRLCGALAMILNLAVGGMAVQMIWENKAVEYSQTAVIITAAYTFYCFISSVANVISFRKRDNAILEAAKNLNLIGAAVSMYSLQTSMIHVFGSDDDHFHRMMNGITGGIVLVIVLGIASMMIIKGTKQINTLIAEKEGRS